VNYEKKQKEVFFMKHRARSVEWSIWPLPCFSHHVSAFDALTSQSS